MHQAYQVTFSAIVKNNMAGYKEFNEMDHEQIIENYFQIIVY